MELTECGPAALAIILAYFGRRVSLEELRVACGVSRDGSKASQHRARRAPLRPRRQGLSASSSTRSWPVRFRSSCTGASTISSCSRAFPDTRSILNDPATGPRTRHAARSSATASPASALRFAPGPDFRPGGASAGLLAQLGHRLSGCGIGIGIIAWLSLMLVIPGLVLPGATKAFVDDILVKRFDGWLSPLLVGLAAMFVLQIALSAVQEMALLRLELKLALEQSARVHLACAAPAGGVLQPALRRRPRQPHRLQRPGGPAAGARLRASGGDLLHRRRSSAS